MVSEVTVSHDEDDKDINAPRAEIRRESGSVSDHSSVYTRQVCLPETVFLLQAPY